MRMIGELTQADQAKLFHLFLIDQGIANEIREESGPFEIWIREEDDVARGADLLAEFTADPDQAKFREAAKRGGGKLLEEEKKSRKRAKRAQVIDGRTSLFSPASSGTGPITLIFILVSGLITIASRFGNLDSILMRFFITASQGAPGLPEIGRGEIWRLVTPIFIHFDILHLLFNMMWLFDLGNRIEDRKGSWFLLAFVIIVGMASNLGQYLVSGPSFGGMSGVVYGMLGYVWMKGKYDPGSKLGVHKTTVTMMFIWYFLCFISVIPIANAAHSAGLFIGTAWGLATSLRRGQIRLLLSRPKAWLLPGLFFLFILGLTGYHVFFKNVFREYEKRSAHFETVDPCLLARQFLEGVKPEPTMPQADEFRRQSTADGDPASFFCYRFCLYPEAEVTAESPLNQPGLFMSKLWALYGEPDRVNEEFSYVFRDPKTGLEFRAGSYGAVPAFFCRPEDRKKIVSTILRFDRLIRKSDRLTDCAFTALYSSGKITFGVERGKSFYREEKYQ